MKKIYRSRIQFINEYIGAVSHSVPGQLQVCGPAKPDNHCLKCPNFWLLQFHVDYQLWFLCVFVFVANIEIRRTETNNFCDVCEGDTGLRTDPFTLVSAHIVPGRRRQLELILFYFWYRMYKYQKVEKSTWQVDVPRSGNRQSRSTVPRPRPLPGILMLAQNKNDRGTK